MTNKYENLIDYTTPTIDNDRDFDTPQKTVDLSQYSNLIEVQPDEEKPRIDIATEEVVKVVSPEPLESAMRLTQGDIEYSLTKFKGISPDIAAKVKEIWGGIFFLIFPV